MVMPNSSSRLKPTPKLQIVMFSLLLLPWCCVFPLLYDNAHRREYKTTREICGRQKELNLISSKFLLQQGLVHFSSSA